MSSAELAFASRLSLSKKRRLSEDSESRVYKPHGMRRSHQGHYQHHSLDHMSAAVAATAAASSSAASTSSSSPHSNHSTSRHKRLKTPRIKGEPLPLKRIIEVLDESQMQQLLQNLVQIHPEITETVSKLAPKPDLDDTLALIKSKFDDIFSRFPYKCDIESDYSYLRIKPSLTEFFHCLSDFILNNLPPVENLMQKAVKFLDAITNLIHELPNFTNQEFQYTRLMAYEQIVNCWLIVLNSDSEEEDLASTHPTNNLITLIQDLDLQNKVQHHDLASQGKFKAVASFIAQVLETNEKLHQLSNQSAIMDMITVDYSNYSLAAHTSH